MRSAVLANSGLGLPPHADAPTPGDEPFLLAIAEAPGDLANWTVYADWLQEQSDKAVVRRGLTIAGWLGPKAMKVKYGLPVLARPDNRED